MPPDGMPKHWSAVILLACLVFSTLLSPVPRVQAQQTEETSTEEETSRREVRIDVGGGWGIPIDDVALQSQTVDGNLAIDVNSGPHAYAGVGFVRSIAEKFALGARIRGQATQLRGTVENVTCGEDFTCQDPEGLLWAATLEGRIIITAPEWINPYLLVGLGAVQTTVHGVTVENSDGDTFRFDEAKVTDAGGDIGLGASLPITDYLYFDAEFRVTGALPGGKENEVSVLPFSAGISVGF